MLSIQQAGVMGLDKQEGHSGLFAVLEQMKSQQRWGEQRMVWAGWVHTRRDGKALAQISTQQCQPETMSWLSN